MSDRRVNATIERLISNIPVACKLLEEKGYVSLAGQLKRDCDNLVYWQESGYWQEPEKSLKEILDEAKGDRDWDIVITACESALGKEEEDTDWRFLTPIGRGEEEQ